MDTSSTRPLHHRIVAALIPITSVIAAAGCLLPWERLRVVAGGDDQTTSIDVLHGSGLVACAGVMLALLACAYRLWFGQAGRFGDLAIVVAGALVAAGTGLYTTYGGYAPRQGDGFTISLGAGFFVCAACAVVLIAAGVIQLLSAPLRRSGQS
jgi:hypothetical protein